MNRGNADMRKYLRPLILAFACAASTGALAEDPLLFNDRAACAIFEQPEFELADAIGEGYVALHETGSVGYEFNCDFDEEIELNRDLYPGDILTWSVTGHCEEPDMRTPKLFTFWIYGEAMDEVHLFESGDDEAQTYYFCG